MTLTSDEPAAGAGPGLRPAARRGVPAHTLGTTPLPRRDPRPTAEPDLVPPPAPRPRPRPHSRSRAQVRRTRAQLRAHAVDLGLVLLAVLCALLVVLTLRG